MLAFSIVNFLLVVLTVVILSAGIVEPTAYGEVPAVVTTTWYFSAFNEVEEALPMFAPDSTVNAGDSELTKVWPSYNLLYEYEKSPIVPWVIYCWPKLKIGGSNDASVRYASWYVDVNAFERLSMLAELILVVELNVASDSTSLNSKSIAQVDALVGVVIKFEDNVATCVDALNELINFAVSPVPGPAVILILAPL